jgi:anti-sigma factor RsiW
MPDPRARRLMQEALDDALSPRATAELQRALDADPEHQDEYERLRQVDRLLKTAPLEAAPQALAMRILARLAEGVQDMARSRIGGLALAVALGLVTALLLPLLIGLGLLLINTLTNASALTGVIAWAAGALGALTGLLISLARGAHEILSAYPEVPLALTLIPLGGLWLLRVRAAEQRERKARGDRLRGQRRAGGAADRLQE